MQRTGTIRLCIVILWRMRNMRIAGYNPNSFVDYPGNIAAVIFFGGCNFDCWFCHNRWLLSVDALMDKEEALKRIENKKSFLDAVVLTGGEPTLEEVSELVLLAKSIKEMGLKVKLDTNGTNSEKLAELLPYVDYVAMDVKAPLSKYRQITCVDDAELFSIKRSIEMLKNTQVDNEFRTTVVPTLSLEDMIEIAQTLKGCKHYYLQQYVPVEGSSIQPLPPKTIRSIAEEVSKVLPCQIRGI